MAVTFASVEGKYTAFILDGNCEGWVIGEEEKKMGIKAHRWNGIIQRKRHIPVINLSNALILFSKRNKKLSKVFSGRSPLAPL